MTMDVRGRGARSPAESYRRVSSDDATPDVLFRSCRSGSEGSVENHESVGVTDEESEKARHLATLMWVDGFRDIDGKRALLHDVYSNCVGRGGEELCLRLLARLRTGTYIVGAHGNHIHVCHTCDYLNSTCRCYITKVIRSRFGRWVARTSVSTRNITYQRWRNIAIYLSSGTRYIIKVNHSGGDWVRGREDRAVPLRRSGQRGSPELVAQREDEGARTLQLAAGSGLADNQAHIGSEGERNIRNRRDREEGGADDIIGQQSGQRQQRQHKGETILGMIMSSAVTPLARFFDR
ncbi:unnamed protein product [Bemisia tabaci]|uniref:Uncharacterized protein n=1 Tax=Bemisia tabaci TaxID=7038 RepID=A0A9P0C7S5_BEMTA|nr:unnamed protein product [Bemisia tabaci]